jgi:T-complex protein 11
MSSDNQSAFGSLEASHEDVPMYMHNPITIHRVLLTDASELDSMTVSGHSRSLETASFSAFCQRLSTIRTRKDEFDLESAAQKAYCDNLCQRVESSHDLNPLKNLLLELHMRIRQLIPHRSDLYHLLDDQHVQSVDSIPGLLQCTVTAAERLASLESEARSVSTQAWIKHATKQLQNYNSNSNSGSDEQMVEVDGGEHAAVQSTGDINSSNSSNSDESTNVSNSESVQNFVMSLMYLHYKTDLCQEDKDEFMFTHVWIPKIRRDGLQLERSFFQKRIGGWKDANATQATRQWITSLVNKYRDSISSGSSQEYFTMLCRGWVHDILFRKPEDAAMPLPEVFALDEVNIRSIRNVAKMAVAGSALALHACQLTNQPTSILESTNDTDSPLNTQRHYLARELNDQFKTVHEYKHDIERAAESLGTSLDANISSESLAILRGKAVTVLRGDDSVAQLLTKRMIDSYETVVVGQGQTLRFPLVAGTSDSADASHGKSLGARLEEAIGVFSRQGLKFYAPDLASSTMLACNIMDLVWRVYGDVLLVPAIEEAVKSL